MVFDAWGANLRFKVAGRTLAEPSDRPESEWRLANHAGSGQSRFATGLPLTGLPPGGSRMRRFILTGGRWYTKSVVTCTQMLLGGGWQASRCLRNASESPETIWSRRSDLNGRPAHYEIPGRVRKINRLRARSGRSRHRAAGTGIPDGTNRPNGSPAAPRTRFVSRIERARAKKSPGRFSARRLSGFVSGSTKFEARGRRPSTAASSASSGCSVSDVGPSRLRLRNSLRDECD